MFGNRTWHFRSCIARTKISNHGIDFQNQSGQYFFINDKENKQVLVIPGKWLVAKEHYIDRDDVTITEILQSIGCDSGFTLRKCTVPHRFGKL